MDSDQFILFRKLQNSEKAHAFQVMQDVQANGFSESYYLKATLLHDVGKIVYSMNVWERSLAVIFRFTLKKVHKNMQVENEKWWMRGSIVAEKHPEWGAELLLKTDLPSEIIEIVKSHHLPNVDLENKRHIEFHKILQTIDEKK